MADTKTEAEDLAELLAGLPDDVREGPFGEVYARRLAQLLEEVSDG